MINATLNSTLCIRYITLSSFNRTLIYSLLDSGNLIRTTIHALYISQKKIVHIMLVVFEASTSALIWSGSQLTWIIHAYTSQKNDLAETKVSTALRLSYFSRHFDLIFLFLSIYLSLCHSLCYRLMWEVVSIPCAIRLVEFTKIAPWIWVHFIYLFIYF